MKNYKRIKRFGAAATAIAMLGTLSVGVFADEADVVEETVPEVVAEEVTEETALPEIVEDVIEAPVAVEDEAEVLGAVDSETGDVKDSDNLLGDTQLDITGVTAVKSPVAGATADEYNYTVTLNYAFDTEKVSDVAGKQVAMVGYTYTKGEEKNTAASKDFSAAEVYAIDQVGASMTGSFTVKMTSKTGAPKSVANDAVLILKIGSDAVADGGAQAVAIDLSGAKLQQIFTATKAAASQTEVSVPYGSSEADAKAALEGITATVSDEAGNSNPGYAVSGWTVKEGITFDGTTIGAENIFVGKVVRDSGDSITFATELTVEVKVTVSALTDGTVTVKGKNAKVGDAGDDMSKFIESITVKSGNVDDTYDVTGIGSGAVTYAWKDGKALDTSAEGNTATLLVTIEGSSKNGRFDLAKVTKEVVITVEAKVTVKYGDIAGSGDGTPDGKVTSRDLMSLERAVAEWEGYEKYSDLTISPGADVFKDGKITSRDLMVLERHIAEWSGYENLPLTKMP